MDRAPRLELSISPLPAPPWAGTPQAAGVAIPTHEVRLRLVNDGDLPVEADAPMAVVPTVTDAAGKAVTFFDLRSTAGYAPPTPPPPPGAPVRRGESRVLATDPVARSEKGTFITGPFGNAALAAGRYRVRVALDLAPTTRAKWIAAFRAAPSRRGLDAEREASRYAAHWREAASYWRGHLESNVIELDVR